MKKQFTFLTGVLLVLVFSVIVYAEEGNSQEPNDLNQQDGTSATGSDSADLQNNEQDQTNQESINEEINFDVDPGTTPDSPFYFVDDFAEKISVGDDPEKALEYKEEKIAEAKAMVDKGKPEEAQKVLDRALEYSEIIEKEVSPEIRNRIEESSTMVQGAINTMRMKTEGEEWGGVNERFDENIEKEKSIETAVELSAKIKELCETLAKLDPLQYSDSCKSGDDSPRWMREQDKELSAEQEGQAKIFFEKLSQCFENPGECDCQGMGVQSFEDFCVEKSSFALKCDAGDENACQNLESGSDPTELLPDYLISTFKEVERKYSKSQFDNYAPQECVEAGVKSPEECSKIMFEINAPQECLDAGLTGESKGDEINCRKVMFEKNTPVECSDAGINPGDSDAPRKCARIMFAKHAPQECLDAGLTGERRDDEKKCKQVMGGQGGYSDEYAPKFNRDCNSIKDTSEKVKCYEEFYNNAQFQVKDDFREREMTDQNTGEKITPEEERARQQCKDKDMGTILEYENGRRVIICVDKNNPSAQGRQGCQSQQQVENLKQDCKNRGQGVRVEDRGGCSWVICVGGETQGAYQTEREGQQPRQTQSGIKCPDRICDDYERMNPYACPEDCGGSREPREQELEQPENRIDEPREPMESPEQFFQPGECPGGICEQQQEQNQQQPTEPPSSESSGETGGESSSDTDGESALTPPTGSAITGRIISSDYGNENTRDGDKFLDYWFMR